MIVPRAIRAAHRFLRQKGALRLTRILLLPIVLCPALVSCGPRPGPSPAVKGNNLASAAPTPYVPRATLPVTGNLLLNGSFETLDTRKLPEGWAVSPDGVVVTDFENDYDAFDGSRAVLLKSVDNGYATLNQYLHLKPDDAGRTLAVSAQGKVPYDGFMFLSVEGKFAGQSRNLAERKWPACPDNWTPVSIDATIPVDIDPGTLRVRVICANKGGYYCRVDDVRATLMR